MTSPRRLPKSVRRFIRHEKARLRRESSSPQAAKAAIKALIEQFRPKNPTGTD